MSGRKQIKKWQYLKWRSIRFFLHRVMSVVDFFTTLSKISSKRKRSLSSLCILEQSLSNCIGIPKQLFCNRKKIHFGILFRNNYSRLHIHFQMKYSGIEKILLEKLFQNSCSRSDMCFGIKKILQICDVVEGVKHYQRKKTNSPSPSPSLIAFAYLPCFLFPPNSNSNQG